MKAISIWIILSLLCLSFQYAQNPKYVWAKNMGGEELDRGRFIAIDNIGNIYITGFFSDTADFDPGPQIYNLISSGDWDIFVQKLDPNGNLVWAKQIGGTGTDRGYSIAVDNLGNSYITGNFSDTVDFDPGPSTYNLTAPGIYNVFTLKLDSLGDFVWAKKIDGSSLNFGYSIALNSWGLVLTVGNFEGLVDFDPGPGTFNLGYMGGEDSFIQALYQNGNFQWAKMIGGNSRDIIKFITTDNNDNIYTTGYFTGWADFDPDTSSFILNSSGGTEDIFIQKLDFNGNFLWARKMGGNGDDWGYYIAIDEYQNIYTIGDFSYTCDFDPGPGTFNLVSSGGSDIFIQKLDSSGNLVWINKIGGTAGSDIGTSIALDIVGNVYATGYFYGTVDFNPDTGVYNITSNGYADIFILKLNNNGKFLWAKNIGSSAYSDLGYGIVVDSSGIIYTTGQFGGTVDFNPKNDTSYLQSHNLSKDIYVCKWSQCIDSYDTLHLTLCNDYISPSGNNIWSVTGIYQDTIANAVGCDSIITVNLTINKTFDTTSIIACGGYISPSGNHTWFSSGIYNDTIPNSLGCDSIITIDLIVKSNSYDTIVVTECNFFTSPSGNIWINSGIYLDTLSNSIGCDSVLTVDLTIIPVDTLVIQTGSTFTANASGASYQWYECDSLGYLYIPSANNQSFTPSTNGSYAVEVTQHGCVNTSNCHIINNVNINKYHDDSLIKLYPNPTDGKFIIDLEKNQIKLSIEIFNPQGQLIYKEKISNTVMRKSHEVDISQFPNALYTIKVKQANGLYIRKIIKNN
ncbi:SBBP repeat-containing protein [candidate division KSB1 bacterium]